MGHESALLNDMLVFLFAAGVLVPLLRRTGLPAVLGFILSGVALGPGGLGAWAHDYPALAFFTINEPEAAAPFAELGILFLLFLLGLELSFEKLWALRRLVFGAGAFQVALSAAVIGGAAWLAGLEAPAAVVVGSALALSSTAIVMQLLLEQKRAAQPVGRTALGILLFQDLLVAPILIFVGFLGRDAGDSLAATLLEALVEGALAVVVIFAIGRFALRRAFGLAAQTGGRDFLMALTLLTVVGAAVITAGAGLSLALGAFLAGLLLGETEFKHQTEVDLEPFKDMLLGVFFMTVGMSLDLAGIASQLPWVLAGLGALLAAKAVVLVVVCRLFSVSRPISIESAALLAPAGEFAFVVLSSAVAGGLLERSESGLVAAVAGLSMLSIPLIDRLGRKAALRGVPAEIGPLPPENYADLQGHVIVAGFGRVGNAIANILRAENMEFVALDRDPRRVAACHERGWKIYLGDAERPEILERAGARGAAMFIVTVDDAEDAEHMVRGVRSLRSQAPILARARDAEHADRLQRAGATFVIPDAVEAGLQLAARALEETGYSGETVRDLISGARDVEYRASA